MNPRKHLVLRLLNEDDQNRINGRTRLQKLVFLAQQETSGSLPGEYSFIPYDYGPFSANLLHEVDDLKEDNLVEEQQVRGPNGKKYIYELTETGKEELSAESDNTNGDDIESIQDAAQYTEEMFNNMPITRLLEYVYNNYPEYAEESVLQ